MNVIYIPFFMDKQVFRISEWTFVLQAQHKLLGALQWRNKAKCRLFNPSNLLTKILNEKRSCFVLI